MNDDILARADVSKLIPAYDSKEERWWATYGALLLGKEIGGTVMLDRYHPFSVNLPGGSYEFDFYHILSDGREVCVEVKALILKIEYHDAPDGTTTIKRKNNSRVQKGYRDTRSKLRAAAELNPQWLWYEARVDPRSGDCELELIEA